MNDRKPETKPADQLREAIAAQLRSLNMFVPANVRETLKLIDSWVEDVERRVDLLAAQQLRVHYGIEPHSAQLDGLASMGPQARTVGLCKPVAPPLPPHIGVRKP